MVILIDGVDNTGKTTLAREFERRGFRYVHYGVPEEGQNLFAEYAFALADGARGPDTVIDRLHLAELVYGNAVRGGSRLRRWQVDRLNQLALDLDGHLILADGPQDTVESMWMRRLNLEYVKDPVVFRRLQADFREYFRSLATVASIHRSQVHHYFFTEWLDDASGFANRVLDLARAR